ncbi:MAG TPA: methylated-DNA--[protein]-cysteine S-methyltransferase [Planctomycetia bacterium]|nr:methylated-DNA--[protein]-cysteine S-methyltransferase [Planctomycetia bacterium]
MSPLAATHAIRNSPFGWFGVLEEADGPAVLAVRIGLPDGPTVLEGLQEGIASRPTTKSRTADLLERYFAGEPVDFKAVRLAPWACTDFEARVREACRRLEWGTTATYGELAARAKVNPRAARAVGSVMRRNRWPIIVPCHRVLGSGGLGGYSAPSGLDLKRRLLALEGIEAPPRREAKMAAANANC